MRIERRSSISFGQGAVFALSLAALLLSACRFTGTPRTYLRSYPDVLGAAWVRYSEDLRYHDYDRLVLLTRGESTGERRFVVHRPNATELATVEMRWPYDRISRARQIGYVWASDGAILRRLLVWFNGYVGQRTDHEFLLPGTVDVPGRRSGRAWGVVDMDVDVERGVLYVLSYYYFGSRLGAVVLSFSDSADDGRVMNVAGFDANGDPLGLRHTRLAVDSETSRIFVASGDGVTVFDDSLVPLYTGSAVPETEQITDIEAGSSGMVLSSRNGSGSRLRLFAAGVPGGSTTWSDIETDARRVTSARWRSYLLAGRRLPDGTFGCSTRAFEVWAASDVGLSRNDVCR